jgi:hypothetical protein
MSNATSLAVIRAVNSERQLLQQMLELYQHDLSDTNTLMVGVNLVIP